LKANITFILGGSCIFKATSAESETAFILQKQIFIYSFGSWLYFINNTFGGMQVIVRSNAFWSAGEEFPTINASLKHCLILPYFQNFNDKYDGIIRNTTKKNPSTCGTQKNKGLTVKAGLHWFILW